MSAAGDRTLAYLGLGGGPRLRKTGWGCAVLVIGSISGGVLFGATSSGTWALVPVGIALFALAVWIGRRRPIARPVGEP